MPLNLDLFVASNAYNMSKADMVSFSNATGTGLFVNVQVSLCANIARWIISFNAIYYTLALDTAKTFCLV